MDGLIYAYNPKSAAQEKYTQERRAALAEQRKQRKNSQDPVNEPLQRTTSYTSVLSTQTIDQHFRVIDHDVMETPRLSSATASSTAVQDHHAHQNLLREPFELRYGRRYLKEVPYPLPVDVAEIQRQNLQTLLYCTVFGAPICSPNVKNNVPKTVLEVACGSAYWSATLHDYFSSLGQHDVSFTGLDVAPLAPDLSKQGVNWTFVQHDIRRIPFPFDDESFDLVMLKDVNLAQPLGLPAHRFLDECIRLVRPGGTLELWASDYIYRSLLPHTPPAGAPRIDQELAAKSAVYLMSPNTPFAPAQNKYLSQASSWIQDALDRKQLPPTPCAKIGPVLFQEPNLDDVGVRRMAIPLGELRWERDAAKHGRNSSDIMNAAKHDSVMSKGKARLKEKPLTPDQSAIRQTALLTALQMIDALEPVLREVNGKNSEEWSHWWSSIMADLMNPSRLKTECLEVGAWWATKVEEE